MLPFLISCISETINKTPLPLCHTDKTFGCLGKTLSSTIPADVRKGTWLRPCEDYLNWQEKETEACKREISALPVHVWWSALSWTVQLYFLELIAEMRNWNVIKKYCQTQTCMSTKTHCLTARPQVWPKQMVWISDPQMVLLQDPDFALDIKWRSTTVKTKQNCLKKTSIYQNW